MKVRIGCEACLKALMGGAQRWGMRLLAKSCLHYRPILPFDESLIVGLAGAGFGEVDQQLAEERGDPPIDIFRAIVRIQSLDYEGKRLKQLLQGREQIRFTDFLQGTDHLKLCDLMNRLDRVDPLLFIPILLRHCIDAGKKRLPCGVWLGPLTDAGASGPCFLH